MGHNQTADFCDSNNPSFANNLASASLARMMEFKETSTFTRDIEALFSDDEFARLQADLAAKPEFGNLIQGGGGIRKLRWRLPGRGKSGGVRIIYYWTVSADQVLLLRAYAKSAKTDLTPREISELRQIVTDEYP